MKQKRIESNALIVSAFIDIIMAGAGFFIFLQTGIQALFLDFFFSLIASASAISAVVISNISKRKTPHYPNGLYFLEPLYAIFKSLLTLSLLVISVFTTAQSAYLYFTQGIGEVMNTSPIIPYSIAMIVLCFGLGIFNRHQNNKINNTSTILTAESKGNFIDGILSLGIGIAVIPLSFTPIDSSLGFLHYTGDFFITTILALFSLKEPVRALIDSFRELSGGTAADKALVSNVEKTVEKNITPFTPNYKCCLLKVGMQLKIEIHLLLEELNQLDLTTVRQKILLELKNSYDNVDLVFIL